MAQEVFLEELEKRLEENRVLAEKSILPKQLYGLASYLGFHSFRSLVIVSGLITIMGFYFFYGQLVAISKQLFLFL